MDDRLHQHFSCLLKATIAKKEKQATHWKQSQDIISKEYDELELVPPAPGDAGRQHDMMVEKGNYFVRRDKTA